MFHQTYQAEAVKTEGKERKCIISPLAFSL